MKPYLEADGAVAQNRLFAVGHTRGKLGAAPQGGCTRAPQPTAEDQQGRREEKGVGRHQVSVWIPCICIGYTSVALSENCFLAVNYHGFWD